MDKAKKRTLRDLTPDPSNANQGTERGTAMIEESFSKYGAGRSLLADKNGVLIAGNKSQAGAIEAGIEDIIEVHTTGDQVVVVVRDDLDLLDENDHKARILAYMDNAASQHMQWNAAQVLIDMQQRPDVLAAAFTPDEVKKIIERELMKEAGDAPEPKLDQIETVHEKWQAALGDLWLIPSKNGGEHRLVCGDSTDPEVVKLALGDLHPGLMVTDPPYGVQYDAQWREDYDVKRGSSVEGSHATGKVMNDDIVDWSPALKLFPGDVMYVWHAGVFAPEVGMGIKSIDFEIRGQIIWRKQHFAMSRGAYHWQHEPAYYAVRKGKPSNWRGDRTQSTIWDIPNMNAFGREGGEDVPTGHSTQKPIETFRRMTLNHTLPGDAVYDPFQGAGTMIAAAELTARIGIGIELDPRYVSLSLERFKDMGLEPYRAE